MRAFPFLSLLLLAAPVAAQVVKPVSSQDASGTIAVTSAYQTVRTWDANRSGCTIQNVSAHAMTVKFGASVWALPAGQAISCNNGPIVLTDQVQITGTAGDAYTAAFQ